MKRYAGEPSQSRGVRFFEFQVSNCRQQSAQLGLIVGPFNVPLRFHLLVMLLLAIKLLFAGHEAGRLLLDVGVAAFRPSL